MTKVVATVVSGVVGGVTKGGKVEIEKAELANLVARGFVAAEVEEVKAAPKRKAPSRAKRTATKAEDKSAE